MSIDEYQNVKEVIKEDVKEGVSWIAGAVILVAAYLLVFVLAN